MWIYQEEIFGPVLTAVPFKDTVGLGTRDGA
jgi:acyl-CoA reductase-like NAD-dependent aldehyde dehydrogenase